MACFVISVVPESVAVVVAGQVRVVVCWYVSDKEYCVALYLTCSLLLLIACWSSLLVFLLGGRE